MGSGCEQAEGKVAEVTCRQGVLCQCDCCLDWCPICKPAPVKEMHTGFRTWKLNTDSTVDFLV